MPKLGVKGIFGLTLFRDVFVASGCGVGGGSLGYANTLYRARPAFYRDPQWHGLADWEAELAPHYETAERMLGVTEYDEDSPAAPHLGTFRRALSREPRGPVEGGCVFVSFGDDGQLRWRGPSHLGY
jgi:choline dehydrogenase-like flavoprotein